VGDGEVTLDGGLREGADGFGVERLGFGAEEHTGTGVIFLRHLVGVEVVGCGEDPGARGDRGDSVGEEAEGASGGVLRREVRGGDEDGFVGEGEGEVAERGLEGLLRQRNQANEKAAGGNGRGCCVEVDIGLRGGHRSSWTFSFRLTVAQVIVKRRILCQKCPVIKLHASWHGHEMASVCISR
jgi:hypothetical protein